MSIKKKVFGQMDATGVLHIAFVGTEEELKSQIEKKYAETMQKIKDAHKKYQAEFEKVKDVDLLHLTAENIEDVAKHIYYKKMILKTIKDIADFKKPSVEDGTYFVLDYIGKAPQLEDK